jgi:hypothetical protein
MKWRLAIVVRDGDIRTVPEQHSAYASVAIVEHSLVQCSPSEVITAVHFVALQQKSLDRLEVALLCGVQQRRLRRSVRVITHRTIRVQEGAVRIEQARPRARRRVEVFTLSSHTTTTLPLMWYPYIICATTELSSKNLDRSCAGVLPDSGYIATCPRAPRASAWSREKRRAIGRLADLIVRRWGAAHWVRDGH